MRQQTNKRGGVPVVALLIALFTLTGCGIGPGAMGPAETPTTPPDDQRVVVPTFTATAVEPPTNTPEPIPPTNTPEPIPPTSTPEPTSAEPTAEPTSADAPTETPAPAAKLTVGGQIINARSGPGTTYGLVGAAEANQSFDIVGKNAAGDWWQVCCINGQQAWIFGALATASDAGSVPVAADIPAPPVAAVPTTAPAAPPAAAPTTAPAAPAPTDTPAPPAPAPSGDACAGIGGDGCKFKVREGPKFAPNGGTEIKLQLIFVHSGVDGGQPQGSYFVVMLKDGQKLPISDGVRSLANSSNQGTLGAYNYEYKIGIGDIPGGNVAGNYVMYVLDGNGERDSQDISFSIPEGQGEVWVKWDQG